MNEQLRLFDFLNYQQAHFPKADMLSEKVDGQWVQHSTEEVIKNVNQLSAGLLKLGLSGHDLSVEKQDKIAIISRNRPEWVMLDLATQMIGVLICPIYPTTNAAEIEYIFNDAAIKYVFVSGEDLIEKVESIRHKVPSLLGVYSFDEMPGTPYWKALLLDVSESHHQAVEAIQKTIHPENCVTIIYTSGTTGFPKGVMLSHRNVVSNVLNAISSFPFPDRPNARALSFLPLNHIFERLATYIFMRTGISIYYAESLDTIGENLKEVQPTLFTTVPRLLEKMFDKIMSKGSELKGLKRKLFYWAVALAERYDNLEKGSVGYQIQLALANAIIFKKWRAALGGKVKFVITGGAACQKKLLRIFNGARIPVFEGYGPTENSPVISVNCFKKGGMKFGTAGLVIDGQEVKIEADGEICVRGSSVMMGYYKRPELTSEVIIDGWLHTGDIGEFENGKYLKITDRKKELFKTSGGKYVAPQVIENKLKESPFIEQIMVVGADQKFVAAIVVPAFAALEAWMKSKQLPFHSIEEAVQHPAVIELYDNIRAENNQHFNHVEQLRKIALLTTEWSVAGGEMTPKLSIKRKVIFEKYATTIHRIYQ